MHALDDNIEELPPETPNRVSGGGLWSIEKWAVETEWEEYGPYAACLTKN